MDLFPTVMALSGTGIPAGLQPDSINLAPLMSGTQEENQRVLFWRFGKQKAVRSGKWKLVVDVGNQPGVRLFNLVVDLAESRNLAADFPDVVKDLENRLAAWEKDVSGCLRGTP
jgi:arylsulfatase A-like enzyme